VVGNGVAVFLTVDTETSIGGAFRDARLHPVGYEKRVYGLFKGRAFGIPLMMTIAEKYGIRLTFFVETLASHVFGLESLQKVVQSILQRGHDVQLHLHPNYRTFGRLTRQQDPESDFMHAYSASEQRAMLEHGVETLHRCGVPRVSAFRAGCYGADESTVEAMRTVGLVVDSSYNAAHVGAECGFQKRSINDVWRWNGEVFELPVSCFHDRSFLGKKLRPLDINGTGFGEAKDFLQKAHAAGTRCVVMVLHSFSFIKPYDVQYTRVRIRYNVIKRFRRLCAYLAHNRDKFSVHTVGEWTLSHLKHAAEKAVHQVPTVCPVYSWGRLVEQAWDHWV